MAENPHFLPPTNQTFHSNFPIPNNSIDIPPQLDNQITQLGFGNFYYHDQEQQQRGIWAGQQNSSSNSHYEPQGRERFENGLTNNNNNKNAAPNSLSLPSFPSVNFCVGQNGDYGKVGGIIGEEEEDDALYMGGSEQFGVEGGNSNLPVVPCCWPNQQGDSAIKQQLSFGKSHFSELPNRKRFMETDETNDEEHNQNQNKCFKFSEEPLLAVAEPARQSLENNGNVETIYGGSVIKQINITNHEPVQDRLEAINNGNGKEALRNVQNEQEEEKSFVDDFLSSLVNQVMHHQENLHQRLLQTIERLDKERKQREEAWRKEELARLNQQAIARAHDQALASSREATIVSCLEKITGQSFIIPGKTNEVVVAAENMNVMNKRWRKMEVETLIRIRTSLERQFCDPALKDFLWEEISKLMGSMGYRRSGQRCKEKWANINGYYKKAKENSKVQGSHKLKSCPYFQQLDQFYSSKSLTNGSSSSYCSTLQGKNLLPFGSAGQFQRMRYVQNEGKLKRLVEANNDEGEEDEEEDEGSDED